MKPDQQRVKDLLTEAITMLCKSGLNYRATFSIEGLLGITLDEDEVFLINIKETHQSQIDTLVNSADAHERFLVNGTKTETLCNKTEVIPLEEHTAVVGDQFLPHSYSVVQSDGHLSNLVIKEEHISESDSELHLQVSQADSPKRRRLSITNNSPNEQLQERAKAELLPTCSMWGSPAVTLPHITVSSQQVNKKDFPMF